MLHSLILTILLIPACSATTIPAATEFIRTSCGNTLYPDLCYHSLSRYAVAVRRDPARLAAVAVRVSLSSASRTSAYLRNLTGRADYGPNPRAAAALRDCLSVFKDAVDQIRESLGQMRGLTGNGERLRFEVNNVQTWMSAALTNEDTCTDGFDDVDDCPVKVAVRDRALWAREATSNALALVNGFVTKVTGP
ncbi:Plant invertase/pectin methylesterase inhibitor superfamily protein [Striga hermonthica]|uniref:Plant invertase/pectin methylesterase inhibitor superfamily protein n=1 Tax=Striga hermonthica TaxID=68872 RepID=A0A9N7MHT5_STRHE|nr:Plant invertase/pectin methylesterase inhibitor superfamily protein [Striga hermonthica]